MTARPITADELGVRVRLCEARIVEFERQTRFVGGMQDAPRKLPANLPPPLAEALEQLDPSTVAEVLALLPVAPTIRARANTESLDEIAAAFAVSYLAVRVLLEATRAGHDQATPTSHGHRPG